MTEDRWIAYARDHDGLRDWRIDKCVAIRHTWLDRFLDWWHR